jgi:hypothetical protein
MFLNGDSIACSDLFIFELFLIALARRLFLIADLGVLLTDDTVDADFGLKLLFSM